MNKTKIEYLDFTWNPIAMRCTPVGEACRSCWHLRMAKRLSFNPTIYQTEREAYAGGPPVLKERELEAPLRKRKPARIGVLLMGDLFHESIPGGFLVDIFRMMLINPQYAYFLLTKRPKQMMDFLSAGLVSEASWIWLGVSVWDQPSADENIPILLQIPAKHRWVSYEPALGSVDFGSWVSLRKELHFRNSMPGDQWAKVAPGIDWVVCGGETGPGARPMHPDWVRSVRDQCKAAGTPFFFKGWGSWLPLASADEADNYQGPMREWDDGIRSVKVLRKQSALLDGQEWREMPR